MFDEPNLEFALKLDSRPNVERRRLPTRLQATGRQLIIVVGGSHAGRLADALRSTYPEVMELSVRGWKLSSASSHNLASNIKGILEDETSDKNTVQL